MIGDQKEVVLHLVQDVLEDVEVFANDEDALQHLSVACNEHFTSVEAFIDWQEQHQGYADEYRWLEVPEECVKELEDAACVGRG